MDGRVSDRRHGQSAAPPRLSWRGLVWVAGILFSLDCWAAVVALARLLIWG